MKIETVKAQILWKNYKTSDYEKKQLTKELEKIRDNKDHSFLFNQNKIRLNANTKL